MIIKEVTPPVERIFKMELDGKELAVVRKALALLIEKEKEDRQQQIEHRRANIDPDTEVLALIPPSADEDRATHLISNIRHVERAGFPVK